MPFPTGPGSALCGQHPAVPIMETALRLTLQSAVLAREWLLVFRPKARVSSVPFPQRCTKGDARMQ